MASDLRTAPFTHRLRPARRRLRLGPVPLVVVVGVQLIAVGVLVALIHPNVLSQVCGASLVGVGALMLIRPGGQSLLGVMSRRRAVRARLGSRRLAVARVDAERRIRDTGDTGYTGDIGLTGPDAAGGLFDGLRITGARDRRGQAYAEVRWAGQVAVALTLSEVDPFTVGAGARCTYPLQQIYERVLATGVPVENLTLLATVGVTAFPTAPILVIRLRPGLNPEAVRIRGGGPEGVTACCATALSQAEAALREVGLRATPVTTSAVPELMRSLLTPQESAGAVQVAQQHWSQTWRQAYRAGPQAVPGRSGTAVHRTYVARRISADADLSPLWRAGGPVRVVALELTPNRDGARVWGIGLRVLVRVVAAGDGTEPGAADLALRPDLVPGLDLVAADGDQLSALRATNLPGEGLAADQPVDRAPDRSRFGVRLVASTADLDRLAPPILARIMIGIDVYQRPVAVSLFARRPRLVLAIGNGQAVTELFQQALQTGAPAVVVTDRPAPWVVATDQAGASDRVLLVPDDRALRRPPPGPMIVVSDGVPPFSTELGRAPWQVVLHRVATVADVPPGILERADLVMLSRGLGREEGLAARLGVAPDLVATVAGRWDRALLATRGTSALIQLP